MILPDDKVVIVGAGCFGLSTAYHLLKRGFEDVTVIDQSMTLPAPDAASNDFNRIVRTSYADSYYAKLAQEAIHLWRDGKEWKDTYHESGVVVLGSGEGTYADESHDNDMALGARLQALDNGHAIRGIFPPQIKVASFTRSSGYLNRDGRWANAFQGLSIIMSKVVALNGKIIPGKGVKKILRQGGKTTGVQCSDGTLFSAALVILATGSWTASAFPELELSEKCLATGQCIAMIQLTKEGADAYRQCPVVLDFSSGFYVFPPNEVNIVKVAIHAAGYTHTLASTEKISTPRTVTSDPERGLFIPKTALMELRHHLREVYPDLAEKPFLGTRLCWYTDSPDGDWFIGSDPVDPSLMLATAGSGHAYKFLPVIGRLVAEAVQGTLEPYLAQKFAVHRQHIYFDRSRFGRGIEELDLDQLCGPEDFAFNLLGKRNA